MTAVEADDEDDAGPAASVSFDPQAALLYRDALMLVLNKPSGLPVHKGPGGGVTLTDHLDALRFGLPKLPQLAHRLDRDTSGCLVLGRHAEALRRLGKLFAQNRAKKTYWALVRGAPPDPQGRMTAPLLRQQGTTGGFGFRMVVDAAGQEAATDYRLLGSKDGISWLELKPQTGRTHQLRVHCAHLGCPIIGDTKYGHPPYDLPLMLHARQVVLPLYPKKPPVSVTAPPPTAMQAWLDACGLNG